MKITMLSTFGPEVRGISYYSDCLLDALQRQAELEVVAVDYDKIYPDFLHPASKSNNQAQENRIVHYLKPSTWNLLRFKPDIIHLQIWTFVTGHIHRSILSEARRQNIPTVITLHNPDSHERAVYYGAMQNRCLKLADRIIIHDQCGVSSIRESLRGKVRVIPHGTEDLQLNPSELNQVDQEFPYLLYFGNIRPYKGVDLLLTAWRQVAADIPHIRLIIAGQLWEGGTLLSRLAARLLGTEQYARKIRQQADDPALQRVEFRPQFIEDQELDKLISGARYTIFPYLKFSGHSGAVARSASHGTPVLVSDVGGLSSLAIDSGNVFKAGECEALTALLKNKLQDKSADLAERESQLEKAQSFSWENVARSYTKLYQELCPLKKETKAD